MSDDDMPERVRRLAEAAREIGDDDELIWDLVVKVRSGRGCLNPRHEVCRCDLCREHVERVRAQWREIGPTVPHKRTVH